MLCYTILYYYIIHYVYTVESTKKAQLSLTNQHVFLQASCGLSRKNEFYMYA